MKIIAGVILAMAVMGLMGLVRRYTCTKCSKKPCTCGPDA